MIWKFFRGLATRNLRYKVLALILALATWYSVTERSFEVRQISRVRPVFMHPENIRVRTDALDPIALKLNCPGHLLKDYELTAQHFMVEIVLGPQRINEALLIDSDQYSTIITVPLDRDMVRNTLPEKVSRLVYIDTVIPRELRVPVSLIVKRVPLQTRLRGEPQAGFVAGTPELSRDEIELTGSEEALAKVHRIDLPAIDLTGLSQDAATQVEIDREEIRSLGVRVLREEDRRIAIRVPVEPALKQRTLSGIPVQLNNRPASVDLTYSPISVEITLEGRASEVDSVTADQLTAEVDLTGFPVGTHQIPYTVRGLSESIRIPRRSVNTIEVKIAGRIQQPILERDLTR